MTTDTHTLRRSRPCGGILRVRTDLWSLVTFYCHPCIEFWSVSSSVHTTGHRFLYVKRHREMDQHCLCIIFFELHSIIVIN